MPKPVGDTIAFPFQPVFARVGNWLHVHWPGSIVHDCKCVVERIQYSVRPGRDIYSVYIPDHKAVLHLRSDKLNRESDRMPTQQGPWFPKPFWCGYAKKMLANQQGL